MKRFATLLVGTLLIGFACNTNAQTPAALTGQTRNYISTGMPILLIAPDATAGAMGDPA